MPAKKREQGTVRQLLPGMIVYLPPTTADENKRAVFHACDANFFLSYVELQKLTAVLNCQNVTLPVARYDYKSECSISYVTYFDGNGKLVAFVTQRIGKITEKKIQISVAPKGNTLISYEDQDNFVTLPSEDFPLTENEILAIITEIESNFQRLLTSMRNNDTVAIAPDGRLFLPSAAAAPPPPPAETPQTCVQLEKLARTELRKEENAARDGFFERRNKNIVRIQAEAATAAVNLKKEIDEFLKPRKLLKTEKKLEIYNLESCLIYLNKSQKKESDTNKQAVCHIKNQVKKLISRLGGCLKSLMENNKNYEKLPSYIGLLKHQQTLFQQLAEIEKHLQPPLPEPVTYAQDTNFNRIEAAFALEEGRSVPGKRSGSFLFTLPKEKVEFQSNVTPSPNEYNALCGELFRRI
ncbi:MAG: hypothetical protein A3C44_08360 [Gammaproteobacteria bacterium RIFCSPHIGHO2_02_FULL_39_13]|nr:MAG: hypothetical protein A3C44_08360 [Gammaproteobacteria bacterium RIFCSPHIGHO2_02_FULL_39_13]OGT49957.1 MAG: hypothetical protein A3E53_06255 [Gammaproteobacteria bacterium RIFCSPHIGHO2_12_FULL_39_24]